MLLSVLKWLNHTNDNAAFSSKWVLLPILNRKEHLHFGLIKNITDAFQSRVQLSICGIISIIKAEVESFLIRTI